MIYIIFILFVLYTFCCCLDGQDLKPKWHKWLGNKLHEYGNKFVKHVIPIDVPPMNIKIYEQHIEPIKIKARSIISEFDLLHNGYNQDRYMDYVIRNNNRKIFEEIEKNDLINTEIMNTIKQSAKLKKYQGIIYINKNLDQNLIMNLQSKFKNVNEINKIVLIDNSLLPKHKDLYAYCEEIFFYERFYKNKIIDCQGVKDKTLTTLNDEK